MNWINDDLNWTEKKLLTAKRYDWQMNVCKTLLRKRLYWPSNRSLLRNEAFGAIDLNRAFAMEPARMHFGYFRKCDWHDFSLWGLTFELTGPLRRVGIWARLF